MTVLLVVLGVLVFLGGRYAFVRAFPWKPCRWCGGRGRIYGPGGHRDCGHCGTSGRVRRWGAGAEP